MNPIPLTLILAILIASYTLLAREHSRAYETCLRTHSPATCLHSLR